MSCTTKHIDEFCNNFLSLNMNLGGASGPTLECQILGEPDYTKSHELIVEGVKQKLTEANIPIVGEWTLLSVSTDKSSGGIITTVRMIDSVWAKANSMHIGVTGESGGDIMLGNEYFHIAGVPVGGYGVPGEAILRRSFLLDNYDKLNKGTHYITTSGNIVSKPTNLTSQEFLSTYMPGIPHPNVEFGSFYYTPAELFSTVSNNLGIQTPQNSSTTSSDDLPAINFYGLYNTSGTVFDVMSQIGNTFGFLYVHNSFWGSRYLNLDGNIGKIDVLTEAGISAPNSSVSSSFEVDYSSGLTWNATKITKMPGRYKRDVPDSRDPTDGQMFFSVEQRVGSYNGGIIDSGDIYGEFTEPFANRKLYPHSCNPELSPEMEEKVGSDAYLLNKTQYNHVVDYAWTSGGTPQGNRSNAVSYITESGKVEQFAYNDLCANGYIVPYLEKIKFSLINELYTGFSFKYLESLNINVVDGKMIANYAFSQKNMMPDFKGLAGARVKLQNMI